MPGPSSPLVPVAARPGRRREDFERAVRLAGWSSRSRWGYDSVLECYWAELWPEVSGGREGPPVVVGPGHLIPTVTGLARAIAWSARLRDDDALLALTA